MQANREIYVQRATRIPTALAMIAIMSVVAVSLWVACVPAPPSPPPPPPLKYISLRYIDLCSNGIAVPNPTDNPGFVSDCAALLAARDTLDIKNLNWRADHSISRRWSGVFIENNRVSRLVGIRMYGEIPPQLGNLVNLQSLSLGGQLTGEIPSELGNLANLDRLDLEGH